MEIVVKEAKTERSGEPVSVACATLGAKGRGWMENQRKIQAKFSYCMKLLFFDKNLSQSVQCIRFGGDY